ncbi:MAG: hypothetical protein DCF22_25285 [Leptolyngbya sp.]|nr:MAG: hypothetical protein DCF22_25285 [Leptolyngbya sp.]
MVSRKAIGLAALAIALGLAEVEAIAPAAEQPIAQTAIVQDRKAEGDRLLEQGNQLRQKNQPQQALEVLLNALAIYREIKDRKGEGFALKDIGNAYSELKDNAKNLEYQQQALAIAREIKDTDLEARALNNIGLAHQGLGKPAKEIEYLQQSLTIATNTQNSFMEFTALINLADAYSRGKQPKKVIEFVESALKLARTQNTKEQEARLLLTLAKTHTILKDYQKGIYFAKQSVKTSWQTNNQQLKLECGTILATLFIKIGQEENAINELQKIVESTKKDGHELTKYEARKFTELMIAQIYIQLEDFQPAINLLERGLIGAKNPVERAANLPSLGILIMFYGAIGDNQKANEFGKQALEIAKNLEDPKYLTSKLFLTIFLLYISLEQGKHQETINGAQELLKFARDNKSTDLELFSLFMLAQTYGRQGDYSKVKQYAQQSLTISQERKVPQEEMMLSLLADISIKEGRINEAIFTYRKLLSTDNNNSDVNSRVSLARAYQKLNLPSTAIAFYKQAVNQIEKQRILMQTFASGLQESFLKKSTFGYLTQIKRADVYRELS